MGWRDNFNLYKLSNMASYAGSYVGVQDITEAADVPTVAITVPVADPCDPQAAITVAYGYSGGTAGCLLEVYAYGDDGEGVLCYAGDPTTDLPADSSPVPSHTASAQSDNGTSGSITLTPAALHYWPGTECIWVATILSPDDTSATDSGTQTVDVASIPPATSRRLPDGVHYRNRSRRR